MQIKAAFERLFSTPLAQWIKVGRRGSGKGEGEREYSGRCG